MDKFTEKHIGEKILAVILAAILWMYVMNEQNPPIEAGFDIPIQVRHLPADMVVTGLPETARIKVRGARSTLAGLAVKELVCYVDMQGLTEGNHTIKVQVQSPANTEIVGVYPENCALHLDSIITCNVEVSLSSGGKVAEGKSLKETVVYLKTVKLQGPRSLVEAVAKVVAPINVDGREQSYETTVKLKPLRSDGSEVEGITLSPDNTSIAVKIDEDAQVRKLKVQPITTGQLREGWKIKSLTVEPAEVEVSGMANQLKDLEKVDTEALDITGHNGRLQKEVKLHIPDGVTVKPAVVQVTMEVEKT